MRSLATRTRRGLAAHRVFEQLVGLGAGVLAAVVLAVTLLAFGTSASASLERVYDPASAAAD